MTTQEKDHGNRSGSDDGQPGSEPIQTIHQIERIRNTNDPHQCQRECQYAKVDAMATQQRDVLDENAAPDRHASGNPLQNKLHPSWNRSYVIPYTQEKDNGASERHRLPDSRIKLHDPTSDTL